MPANPNFDDIVTTTLRNRSGKLADNATRTMALLDRLRQRGNVKMADGGRTIVQELEVSLNPNGGWYSGGDVLNANFHEPFSAAEYDWKQAYVPAVWYGIEKLQNQGEYAVINLVTSRIKNSEKSLMTLVSQGVYSDGTGYGGKQMGGLQLMVVASPGTGTVGGIDRLSNTFWRNQTATVTMSGAGGAVNIATGNPSNFLQAMNALSILCTRGNDRPDLYVADGIAYARFLESLQGNQRITNPDMAAAGFTSLKYYGVGGNADVVLDNGDCPTKTMYALNTNYLYLRPHPERNFQQFGGERIPVQQDATVQYVGFAGNLTASNLALQGILTSTN